MLKFSYLYNKKRRKDYLNKKKFLPLHDKAYCNNRLKKQYNEQQLTYQ